MGANPLTSGKQASKQACFTACSALVDVAFEAYALVQHTGVARFALLKRRRLRSYAMRDAVFIFSTRLAQGGIATRQ